MHQAAKKWDDENGHTVSMHAIEDDKFIPLNRPCDWCGHPVDKGFIHTDCAKNESDFWIDLCN